LEQVQEVLAEYAEHLPLTVRQIFYRLVARHGYPKTDRAYANLAEHLVRARRARILPFAHIRDDGVVQHHSKWHASTADFWDQVGVGIRRYRRDRQEGQAQRVELWCESAGMAPQLARVANPYSVPVFSSGGFASLTAVRLIAERALDQLVPTVLLHVGDYDPSGRAIFDAMAEDAAAFVAEDRIIGNLSIEPLRVALLPDQVVEYDLPTAPAKGSDTRSNNWTGGTCQLESLAPDVLATIVRDAIAYWFNAEPLEVQLAAEEEDKIELYRGLPRGTD
jgi:hypothetical protein